MPKYKPEELLVSVASLGGGQKSGWLTKQGGSNKNWRRRFFILKDNEIFYFKSAKDNKMKGKIVLTASSTCAETTIPKYNFAFIINATRRDFFIYADSPNERSEWIEAVNQHIKAMNKPGTSAVKSEPTNALSHQMNGLSVVDDHNKSKHSPNQETRIDTGGSPRKKLENAKQAVPFLKDKSAKVYEFWAIWSESIPARADLPVGQSIEFYVTTSADMHKLTWRTSGPQSIFIQKMVDFFWNVGAPEEEIDRLNDVGAIINPLKIGSWIDMSKQGGMDGGWYFPVDISITTAMEAADHGLAIKEFGEWAQANGVVTAFAVGRDMGAAPPRQTEIRFKLPQSTPEEQVRVALTAFSKFGFAELPQDALSILRSMRIENSADAAVSLSVITSSDGFVRLGLLIPRPSPSDVKDLCAAAGGSPQTLRSFEDSVEVREGPLFVEFQYLKNPFGYGVYKEGFDIVFHYRVGIEN